MSLFYATESYACSVLGKMNLMHVLKIRDWFYYVV